MAENSRTVSEEDFEELKNRLKLIFDADPDQYVNDFAIRRYLRAFKTVDLAFQVTSTGTQWLSIQPYSISSRLYFSVVPLNWILLFLVYVQHILKTNKWRREYGVDELTEDSEVIQRQLSSKKAIVLKHRDMQGKYEPVIIYRNNILGCSWNN